MKPQARRQGFAARVAHEGRHGKRCARERVGDLELERKGIHGERGGVRAQSERRRRRCGGEDFKWLATRETVTRQREAPTAVSKGSTRERSHVRKQNGRTPGPDRRIAVPEQVTSVAIPQDRELCTQRIDLRHERRRPYLHPGSRFL